MKFPNKSARKVAKEELIMSYVYLHRIENGTFIPSEEMIIKLSDGYGLTEDQEFELFMLAKKSHLYPRIKEFLDDDENAQKFFRKIIK